MKVIFTIDAYKKWRAYIDSVECEISGFGRVHYRNGIFLIDDIRILKQKVTRVNTFIDHNAYGKFWDELIVQGEDVTLWKLWWHSHGEIDAFFSSTDEDTINGYDNETKEDNWLLSIVSNRAGKTESRLDIFYPKRFTIPDIDYDITFKDSKLEEKVEREVDEKVEIIQIPKKVKPNTTSWLNSPSGSFSDKSYSGVDGVITEDGVRLFLPKK